MDSLEKTIHIPDLLKTSEGIFKNTEHLKTVYSNITRILFSTSQNKDLAPQNTFLLFNTVEIAFKDEIKEESIYLDYMNSKIILYAPINSNPSEKRIDYLRELLPAMESLKINGIASIFLSLSTNGREEIST